MRKHQMATVPLAALASLILAVNTSARSTAAPGNTSPPAVSGTPKVGSTLTVSNGTWTNSPTSYDYQWQRCTSATSCTDIANAVGSRTSSECGRCRPHVPCRRDGLECRRSVDRAFEQTVVVAATGSPDNTGARRSPATRSSVRSSPPRTARWSNAPTSFRYQWLRATASAASCVAIPGATGKTYGVRFADVSGTLRVA